MHPSMLHKGSKTATDWTALKGNHKSIKTQHLQHHSMSREHTFLHVKLKGCLVISFTRKSTSTKKETFFMGGNSRGKSKKNACRTFKIGLQAELTA
jgi:hypothetical protein